MTRNQGHESTIKLVLFSSLIVSSALAQHDHDHSANPLDWLRDSIPGEPGIDYPIFSEIQDTGFSCEGRVFGGKSISMILIYNRLKEVFHYM